jgi:chromosome segregation ATPase
MKFCFISIIQVLLIVYVSAGCAGGPDVEMEKNLKALAEANAKLTLEVQVLDNSVAAYKLEQERLTQFIEDRERTIEEKAAEAGNRASEARDLEKRLEKADSEVAALAKDLGESKIALEKARGENAELTIKFQEMESRKNEMELQCFHLRDKIASLEKEREESKAPKVPEGAEKK